MVRGRLSQTNRRRPCPVCSKVNGNCRVSHDEAMVLCMTYADGQGDSPLYRYVKASKDGLWGTHILSNGNDFDRDKWERDKAERAQRERELEIQRRERCLTPDQRDREIRGIMGQLTLTPGDRQYLEGRGLTPAVINRCRSVKQWHELAHPAHVNLAGVWKDGRGLNNPYDGILVAIPDHLGRYTALRLHDPNAKTTGNPKYAWLTSQKRGVTPHLAHGEMPIAVYWPEGMEKGTPDRIGLCEGMEWKAQIAANRLGYPVIGFSGNRFHQSKELVKEAIAAINPNAEIVLIPDSGSVHNRHVSRAYAECLEWLESQGYHVTVAWWGQWDKGMDIDEIPANKPVNYITPSKFLGFLPHHESVIDKVRKFFVKRRFNRVPGLTLPNGEIYPTGERPAAWNKAIAAGGTVLDNSCTGDGKSHSVPYLENPWGGRIWYVAPNHRNPSIPEITEQFTDLPPRNKNGFYIDPTDGMVKPAALGQMATLTDGHCTRPELFPALSRMGYDPYQGDGINPICKACPDRGACANVPGWYRHDRREILGEDGPRRIRCAIESMPRDWDYSKDLIILDEPGLWGTPTQSIETTLADLLREAYQLRNDLGEDLWWELDRWLKGFTNLSHSPHPRYGLDHGQILEKLPPVSPELAIAVSRLGPDISDAIIAANGASMDDIEVIYDSGGIDREAIKRGLAAYRANEKRRSTSETLANLSQFPPRALAHILSGKGVMRLKGDRLTITIDRRKDYQFLNEAGALLALDATLTPERLAMPGVSPDDIKVIRSDNTRHLDNLTVTAIAMPGVSSKDLSDSGTERIKALMDALGPMPVISHKAWKDRLKIDGIWFKDNRGVNTFAGEPRMMGIGLPSPNIGAIQDQFLALNGTLEGFEDYYGELVSSEVLQIVGRPRADRYPDRQFEMFLIVPEGTDLSWLTQYGATVKYKSAFEITPEAGTARQFTLFKILQAMTHGYETQTAIADFIGQSQQAISKILKSANVTLAEVARRLANILPAGYTTPPYDPLIRAGCITDELLKEFGWFFDLDPWHIMEDAAIVVKKNGWPGLIQYLNLFPDPIQNIYWGLIWGWLDTGPPPDPA